MAAETVEIKIDIDVSKGAQTVGNLGKALDNTMKSALDFRKELKEINIAMSAAARAGDTKAYDALKKKFTEVKDAAKDFREETVPLEDKLAGVSKYVGTAVSSFQNLSLAMGADKKSTEELMKSFAKVQAITNLTQSISQLQADFGKTVNQLKDVGSAIGKAFIANPVLGMVTAIVAVGAAVAVGLYQLNELATVTDRATRETKLLNEASDKAIENSIQEKVEYGNLFGALKNVNTSSSDRQKIIKEINDSGYVDKLLTEKSSIQDIDTAQKSLNANLLKKYKLQALEEQLVQAYKDQATAMKDLKKSDDGFFTNAINNGLLLITNNSAFSATNYQLADAIDRSKEAAQDKSIVETEIQKILGENINLLGLEATATTKDAEALKKLNEQKALELKLNIDIFNSVGSLMNEQKKLGEYKEVAASTEEEVYDKDFENAVKQGKILTNKAKAEKEYNQTAQQQLKEKLDAGVIGETEYSDKIKAIDAATKQSKIDNAFATANAVGNIGGALASMLGAQSREGAIAGRAVALFQIGVDTAKAISSATSAAAANPANAVTFGGAGLATFAVMIAQILGNIAQAKSLLSQPLPMATGGMVPGSGNRDSVNTILMPGEGVITKQAMRQLGSNNLSAINRGEGITQRVIVVESDITKVQQRVNKVKIRSSISKLK